MFIQPVSSFPQILVIQPPNNIIEFKVADTVVNTVNTRGIMGAGIAKMFKEKYPEMFKSYQRVCDANLLKPGCIWPWAVLEKYEMPPRLILNMVTKDHWRELSKYEWIESGLKSLKHTITAFNIPSVAMPKIGCELDGLDWNIVKSMIFKELAGVDAKVYILE